jgi:hypothetical protein
MTESSSSRVLSFYERSLCMTNITLPDIPAGASTDFKIASQFDAVGSVDAVAFQGRRRRRGEMERGLLLQWLRLFWGCCGLCKMPAATTASSTRDCL